MSSVALAPTAVSRPAVNPWFVATAVVVPTFMEILDTTIATASMRYIAGGLSATMNDSDWVMTSYLAANATILPITGWLSARLGRRRYFLLSIAVFTAASVLCGLATSLEQLILFRVIQGISRRRAPARQPGDPDRRLPAREAGHGHDGVRRGGADRPGHRPDAGRLHHGQLQLALDLPHQPPDRRPRLPDVPLRGRGPRIPQEGAGGAESPAAQFRLHRPGAARPGDELLGDSAQQGAGVGLVQRPLLEGPDAGRPVRRLPGRPDLPGDEDRQPGGQLPADGRAQPRGLQHHHLLRLRRPLRRQRDACLPCSSPCSATTPSSPGW